VIEGTDLATGCESAQLPDTPAVFEAASLGKPVFAYGVVKLAEQGKLDLDAPLANYLPQGYAHVQNPFDDKSPPITDLVTASELRTVTARHILTHTSGLPNWSSESLVFDLSPGTGWQYSGEGYVLLQRAVEAITGVRLDQFMRVRVFEPLGMTHSDYIWNNQFESNFVAGASSNELSNQSRHFRAPIAAATLYTTAADYAKFMAAVLADARIISATVDSPVSVDQSLGLDWGLGWGIERGERDRFIWHWGSNPGFRAFAMASVQSGDGVVILTNSDSGLALAEPIVNAALPGDHKVFKFYMLRDGLDRILCKTFRWCI
jgi:CubicO group peptidase (beta-lactamase class C family)